MSYTASELLWWCVMGVASVSAVAHLVSMLGTRWGDQGATGKSLLFSVLIHCSLLALTAAAYPLMERRLGATNPEEPEAFRITSVDVTSSVGPDDQPAPWRPDVAPDPFDPVRSGLPVEEPLEEEPSTPEEYDRSDEPPPPPVLSDAPAPDLLDPNPDALREETPREQEPIAVPRVEAPAFEPEPETAPAAPTRTTLDADAGMRDESEPRRPDGGVSTPATLPELALTDTSAPADDRPAPFEAPEAERELLDRGEPSDPSAAPVYEPALPEVGVDPEPSDDAEMAGPGEFGPGGETRREFGEGRRTVIDAPNAVPTDVPQPIEPERTDTDRTPSFTESELAFPDLSAPERQPIAGDDPGAERFTPPPVANRGPVALPGTYRLRDLARRRETARKYGGTDASEESVEAALAWFEKHQEEDGRWDAGRFGAGRGPNLGLQGVDPKTGRQSDTGLTGLALLCFLGAGYSEDGGKYSDVVGKATDYLVLSQGRDGNLAGDSLYYARHYCHGIATYALGEAFVMRADPADRRLFRPLLDAVGYTHAMQYADGGWRYSRSEDKAHIGDMSMFGWQCMALKSADNAGIAMSAEQRRRMIAFLESRSLTTRRPDDQDLGDAEPKPVTGVPGLYRHPKGGLAGYIIYPPSERRPRGEVRPPKPAMTAEALFAKQQLGMWRDNPASKEAVAYLLAHPPRLRDWNLYYWYYGQLAMYQYGGPEWDRWNGTLRELLVAEQYKQGPNAGSWPARGPNAEYGGRLYSTALATLCLETYYRFLPLYEDARPEPDGE